MILIIDADPIVYRSGFAAEHFTYHVIAEDNAGKPYERYFETKETESTTAQINAWLNQYKLKELSKEKIILPEPVDHALFLVKQELSKIEKEVKDKYGRITKKHILLSGPNNYRCSIAKQRPYKGNRDPNHKPYHYQAIRDYLVDKGAAVVTGREADDEASILAVRAAKDGKKFVVATIDKDLDQIPGTHFDYRQNVFYSPSQQDAVRWFWVQVIAGDSTDNIPGAFKLGVKKAEVIVDKIIEQFGYDEVELWRAVLLAYGATCATSGCPYTVDQVADVALETARLVYIQKEPNELWNPPGVPMGTMKGQIDD